MRLHTVVLFFSTTLSLHAGKIKELVITPNTPLAINYGSEIQFTFEYKVKKGKVKTFSFDDIHKYFKLSGVNGSWIEAGAGKNVYTVNFLIEKYPSNFELNNAVARLHFDNAEGMIRDLEFNFKLERRCPLVLDFRGEDGMDGGPGKDRGSPILFRNGKDGFDGTNGTTGRNGSALRIEVSDHQDSSGIIFTRLIVIDTMNRRSCYYQTNHPELGVLINSSGGRGGNGGNGGNGSSGKDGEVTDKGTKSPGDGGRGGNGGMGGNGGNGGNVIVILNTVAPIEPSYFKLVNVGGMFGKGGIGGYGGAGGKGINGGSDGAAGSAGIPGSDGNAGAPGKGIEIYRVDQ